MEFPTYRMKQKQKDGEREQEKARRIMELAGEEGKGSLGEARFSEERDTGRNWKCRSRCS